MTNSTEKSAALNQNAKKLKDEYSEKTREGMEISGLKEGNLTPSGHMALAEVVTQEVIKNPGVYQLELNNTHTRSSHVMAITNLENFPYTVFDVNTINTHIGKEEVTSLTGTIGGNAKKMKYTDMFNTYRLLRLTLIVKGGH